MNEIESQFYLPNVCFLTFDNAVGTSYSNGSIINCPSTCYTMRYLSNQQDYPVFGNETYSGNSLVCKSAMHDGRVAPWARDFSPVLIQNNSYQSSIFPSSLRNGINSAKSTSGFFNTYSFTNSRINETTLVDIAIEHRVYLYSQDQPSSITCRSKDEISTIQPINIDQGWKTWSENRLKYFTYPTNMTRDGALNFCMNNNGTLMYWANKTEEDLLQNEISTVISQLFRYQRNLQGNDTLSFYIGLRRISQIKQWQSNIINYNEISISINTNSVNPNEDYCTIIQASSATFQSYGIYAYRCNDTTINAYPLCRLNPSVISQQNDFIYRLETDTQAGNLTGVINFCAELGGYPIYANNAYEWQIIQEIMLEDPNFNQNYVYTGLVSQTKQVTNAFWMPRNTSYNSTLNYIQFAASRGSNRIGYHLSKARDESYYYLYDIDPYTTLNSLRFCRKPDIKNQLNPSPNCRSKQCSSKCLNITLPSQSDDLRFGFYGCFPKSSLASIVYTHSFPTDGDFIRPNLSMDYSVSLRRNFTDSLSLTFNEVDPDLRSDCFEYMNMDRTSTLNETIQLNCISSTTSNKTITGISFKRNFNGLISIGLRDRRLSSHHFRFIDYSDSGSRCSYQGIYHPYINQCICAPGFYGQICENSCPPGYYGQTCDFQCAGDDDYCKGLLICLPDPYGCSCSSGWYGTNCNLICPSDRYGPGCAYQCSCPSCNRFTGICNCIGTECYQGPYTRSEIESRCGSSSNLALLIAVPIVCVVVLIAIIGALLYWRKRRSSDEENLFESSNVRYSTDSYRSSMRQYPYGNDYNNILSERL
ncbi:unnamed protein product [Adineta ricciae]|uniref:EGF-like domain-containing protein n=1 Tax=Adineta ricciae TaxID=249248 RepID=A0A814XFV5_ADIRI|nr:unnamed protein product [Adineta ricciae]